MDQLVVQNDRGGIQEPSALAGAVYPVIEENEVQYYKNGHLNTVDKLNHKFNKKILYNITGLSYFACWYHNEYPDGFYRI